MSVFSSLPHFARQFPNTNNTPPDATEMIQITNVDEFIDLVDGRHIITSPTREDYEGDTDSSFSGKSRNSSSLPAPSTPFRPMNNRHGLSYYRDEDDEDTSFHIHRPYREDDGEAQQRLFTPDVENTGGDEDDIERKGHKHLDYQKWLCVGFLAILLIGWAIWTLRIGTMREETVPQLVTTDNHIDFNDLYNSSFVPNQPSLVWVKNDPRDGVFTYSDPVTRDIILESVEDGKKEVFVKAANLVVDDVTLNVVSFEISQDAEYLLLWTDVTQVWRHSTRSNVYVYKISDGTIFPLTEKSTANTGPKIAYATWSPTGHKAVFVVDNDLYVTDLKTEKRITFDGSATVFNGVPDWVYEEEVFGTDYAVWWSPDSTHLAYLRFNETAVLEYHLQFYTRTNSSYPEEVSIKYPKAGSPNPLVSLHIHSLLDDTSIRVNKNATAPADAHALGGHEDFDEEDRLIIDVVWATQTHSHLLFKQTNRVQDVEVTNMVTVAKDLDKSTIEVVRKYEPSDGGWIDVAQSMVYVPGKKGEAVRYIDLADDGNGFMHLAVFSAKGSKEDTLWLTSGEWEVVAGTIVMDVARNLIHFISTERSPMERHLYTISLSEADPAASKICRTCPGDPDVHGYYSVSFSPKAGYYVLNYEGPDVPTTVVKKVDDVDFESVLEDNAALKKLLSNYELPKTRMVTVKSGGVDMNAMELLPPDFNANEKYPVLFHVYGGPGSQLVSYTFDLSWHTFVASKLRYIVVTVDGRGTGYRGRAYRTGVRGRLGELETIDQVNAARHWSTLDYVDSSRIAIWGWSYGGYMTTKVVEADDHVFSTAMAVAPVTDWRFYDSIYTERYMLTPQLNPEGYARSAVTNMTGFENVKYLLAHGTGDDNVHFQHAAVLVDKLTMASIHNYRVHFFPDSNHGIRYHNANQNIYYLLTEFLWESFGGREYVHIRQEMHGHFEGPLIEH